MSTSLTSASCAFRDAGARYETSPLAEVAALPRGASPPSTATPSRSRISSCCCASCAAWSAGYIAVARAVDHGAHGSDDHSNALCGCLTWRSTSSANRRCGWARSRPARVAFATCQKIIRTWSRSQPASGTGQLMSATKIWLLPNMFSWRVRHDDTVPRMHLHSYRIWHSLVRGQRAGGRSSRSIHALPTSLQMSGSTRATRFQNHIAGLGDVTVIRDAESTGRPARDLGNGLRHVVLRDSVMKASSLGCRRTPVPLRGWRDPRSEWQCPGVAKADLILAGTH